MTLAGFIIGAILLGIFVDHGLCQIATSVKMLATVLHEQGRVR